MGKTNSLGADIEWYEFDEEVHGIVWVSFGGVNRWQWGVCKDKKGLPEGVTRTWSLSGTSWGELVALALAGLGCDLKCPSCKKIFTVDAFYQGKISCPYCKYPVKKGDDWTGIQSVKEWRQTNDNKGKQ